MTFVLSNTLGFISGYCQNSQVANIKHMLRYL